MRLVAVAALVALTAIMPGDFRPTVGVPPTASQASAGQPAWTTPPSPQQTALPRSIPVRVAIPAIEAVSSLMPLQLNPDRTIQVPPVSNPLQAGWYSLGPTPGEEGPGVILGHVDGYDEPGIFFRLRELQPGDRVLVTRQDGITAQFVVQHSEQVPKDHFPTEKVYGATARPELRLITCGGRFDRRSGNYRDNVIVFAVFATSN
jgi:sortase (surface protein transpeptidase)